MFVLVFFNVENTVGFMRVPATILAARRRPSELRCPPIIFVVSVQLKDIFATVTVFS